MDKYLLDILCCPLTKTSVRPARRDEIEAVNRGIHEGVLRTASGISALAPLAEALITQDGKTIYRIEDGIPVMLADEAISTLPLTDFPR
jgi:uncharacterized protein YbaR (Trm112 family)